MELNSPSTARQPPKQGPPTAPETPSPVRGHLEEVRGFKAGEKLSRSFQFRRKRSVPISFFLFLVDNITTCLLTLSLSPSTLLDPIDMVTWLIVCPVISTGLETAVLVFWALAFLHGKRILDWLKNRFAGGYSMVNWPNPQIFGPSSLQAVMEAREWLGGEKPTTIVQEVSIEQDNPDFTTLKTVRIFSLPLARTFLLMSSLVYERSDRLVRQAADIAFRAQQEYDRGSERYEEEMKRAEGALVESERVIKDKAKEWGLEFDGVSDLQTIGGPFASIFYPQWKSDEKPFIVLVFKGTSPADFSEFLGDATIARVGDGAIVGQGSGTVHKGFYTDLFPLNAGGATAGGGYDSIVRNLKCFAACMKREWPGEGIKIPLWVAGHSLGSALASLCYARMLRQPQDLGDDLDLKDCYSFGTPPLGDGDFATAFESTLISRPQNFFRIANNRDFITCKPASLANLKAARSALPTGSVLSYAWVGPCIRLFPTNPGVVHTPPWYAVEQARTKHGAIEVMVVDREATMKSEEARDWSKLREGWKWRSARWRGLQEGEGEGKNPLRWALALLPGFMYDHFPNSYLLRLNNLETSYEQSVRKEFEAKMARGSFGLGWSIKEEIERSIMEPCGWRKERVYWAAWEMANRRGGSKKVAREGGVA